MRNKVFITIGVLAVTYYVGVKYEKLMNSL